MDIVFLLLLPLAALLLWLLRNRSTAAEKKGADGERRVAAEIKRVGFDVINDVYLKSRDGTTQIDHIAKIGNAIVAVETKNYSGAVYGSKYDRDWRQTFRRGQSTSFKNPLHQNHGHVEAVKSIVGNDIDVRGLVVFVGDAKFPQGMPDGVISINRLADWLRNTFVEAGSVGSVSEPWERLSKVIDLTERRVAKKDHKATVKRAKRRRKPNRDNPFIRIDPTF